MKHKKLLSVISASAAALMIAATMSACSASGSGNSTLNANKDYATKVISDFNSNSKAAEFEFSDQAYAKGGTAAMLFKPDISAEDLQQVARNLFLTSITVTNEKGDIVACYPEGAESGKIKDSKDKAVFNKVVKGVSEKYMTDPVYNAEDGTYAVLAGVRRKDADGAVVIGYNTKDYAAVTGTDLAKLCGANAVVIKDGAVLSSTLEGVKAESKLEDLGISADDLKKDSFTVKAGDKSYSAVASTKGDLTVICAG